MVAETIKGLGSVLIGGALNGSFILPMKRMPAWRWENAWLVYSVFGLLVFPWILALATVPEATGVLERASISTLIVVFLFGFGWGVGNILFGLGVARVGMALGFAIILGVAAAVGSLLPFLLLQSSQPFDKRSQALLAGLALVVVGLALCSIAGQRREREVLASTRSGLPSGYILGLITCVLSGVFSAMLNFAFVFGSELQRLSLQEGARLSMSANLTWAVAVTGGFVVNAGYCVYLLRKHSTWDLFLERGIPIGYWFGAAAMGFLWFGGVTAYGIGAATLGSNGGIFGWPLFVSMVIITGNIWGALTGEWAGASRRSYAYSWAGIVILILAVCVISIGGTL
jgi:L-rhamnose-H+ transport protein